MRLLPDREECKLFLILLGSIWLGIIGGHVLAVLIIAIAHHWHSIWHFVFHFGLMFLLVTTITTGTFLVFIIPASNNRFVSPRREKEEK